MTARAWLLTTWGRIRETLQPELFVLRRELRKEQSASESSRQQCLRLARANEDLSERLAQRTRELKAARAKLKAAGK